RPIIVALRCGRAPKEIIDFFKSSVLMRKSTVRMTDGLPVTQMRSLSLEEPSSRPEFMSWRSCPARETSCLFTSLPGPNVNKEVNLDVTQTLVKPWMPQIAAGRPYLYQQDGAPAHTSNLVAKLVLRESRHVLVKGVLAPSSPDLNPCDYYLWVVFEKDTNKRAHNTVDSLKAAIIQAVATCPGNSGSCCWEVQAPCGGCDCERRKLD
ncbi:Transposable element tcb2 transposase, partial [Caligus rogercresseyi]